MASLLADQAISTRQIGEAGLYLHIPFCEAKCHFCDFATFIGQNNKIDSYLSALEKEMAGHSGLAISTLFIGGGTPTVLSPSQIDRLFTSLRKYFKFDSLTEASIEANPDSSTDETLAAFYRNGINRISFGLQTTQPRLLASLGRTHSWEDFLSAYRRARAIGFSNLNVDLMFGLPGQTEADWKETLNAIVDLKPEHISAYALKVEDGTKFKKTKVEADEDLEAAFYLTASRILTEAGYSHYEISNFAKPSFESLHNLKYWKNEETLGLGVAAASYVRGRRFKNTSKLTSYLDSLSKGPVLLEESLVLSEQDKGYEDVFLALRLKEGLPQEKLPRLENGIFDKFRERGYAAVMEGRYRLTPEGWLVSNQLFQHLI